MKVGKKKWKSKGEGGCLVLGKVSEKHLIGEGSELLMFQFIAN